MKKFNYTDWIIKNKYGIVNEQLAKGIKANPRGGVDKKGKYRGKTTKVTPEFLYNALGQPTSINEALLMYETWHSKFNDQVTSGNLATPAEVKAELVNKGISLDSPVDGPRGFWIPFAIGVVVGAVVVLAIG